MIAIWILTNIFVRTSTIGTTRIIHTIVVHKVHLHVRHNVIAGISIIINANNNLRTIYIRTREDHRRRRAVGGSRNRTMDGFRRWGTDMVALPITGRTLTFIRVDTGILHGSVQGRCGDGTTGSTTNTTNTVTTVKWWPRVERKAKQECDGEREQYNQRSRSALLLRGGGGISAAKCRVLVLHRDNVAVIVVFICFSFRCFE